jgi:hypothetical protein
MDADAQTILTTIGTVVTTASVVTAVTPTPKRDSRWYWPYKVIETLGLVFGRAKQQ